MRRSTLLPLLPALILLVAARRADDPKYERHLVAGPLPTMTPLAVTVVDAQDQAEFIAIGTKLRNSTADKVVIHRREEASIVTAAGSFHPRASGGLALVGIGAGPLVLGPGVERSYTFKVEGASGFNVDAFSLELGGFYEANNVGTVLAAPDFTLPVASNSFTAGGFACDLKDASKESQETTASFVCTYTGSGVGYVDARKATMKVPSGQEFANARTKGEREVVLPGAQVKVLVQFKDPDVVDMQMVSLQVAWHDAFSEAALTPIPAGTVAFTVDAAATAAANK